MKLWLNIGVAFGWCIVLLLGWSCSDPTEPSKDLVELRTVEVRYEPGDSVVAYFLNNDTDTLRILRCYQYLTQLLQVYNNGKWLALGDPMACPDGMDSLYPGNRFYVSWRLPDETRLPRGSYRLVCSVFRRPDQSIYNAESNIFVIR
jgi:hypothetical protein